MNDDGATAEVYTSKHFVYGTLIVNCWREYVKMLEKEQKELDAKQAEAKLNWMGMWGQEGVGKELSVFEED